EIGALFRWHFFDMIDTAIGYALAPVDQLDFGAGRDALEEKLAVCCGGLSLELKHVCDLLDLSGLNRLPVEWELIALGHAIIESRTCRIGAIGVHNQPHFKSANRLASMVHELAANFQELARIEGGHPNVQTFGV